MIDRLARWWAAVFHERDLLVAGRIVLLLDDDLLRGLGLSVFLQGETGLAKLRQQPHDQAAVDFDFVNRRGFDSTPLQGDQLLVGQEKLLDEHDLDRIAGLSHRCQRACVVRDECLGVEFFQRAGTLQPEQGHHGNALEGQRRRGFLLIRYVAGGPG